ncbi:hypothetical protein SK128_013245 [Halocaridina rubra]|uniref:Uncharacterized protein n=1 Tax=Halocaridina rubra TaxID=373956 RepID=A0AAN8XL26_HALRR
MCVERSPGPIFSFVKFMYNHQKRETAEKWEYEILCQHFSIYRKTERSKLKGNMHELFTCAIILKYYHSFIIHKMMNRISRKTAKATAIFKVHKRCYIFPAYV